MFPTEFYPTPNKKYKYYVELSVLQIFHKAVQHYMHDCNLVWSIGPSIEIGNNNNNSDYLLTVAILDLFIVTTAILTRTVLRHVIVNSLRAQVYVFLDWLFMSLRYAILLTTF